MNELKPKFQQLFDNINQITGSLMQKMNRQLFISGFYKVKIAMTDI